MTWNGPLNKIDNYRYEIPSTYRGKNNNLKMKTSAVIYADEKMIPCIRADDAPEQVANTTVLPGIVGKAMAMPDIHWGYGFPIGGVAAFDMEKGVITPGGIGFDINCLSKDTEILHEYGYRKKIKDFENKWENNQIKSANFNKKIINTKINFFMKSKTDKKILKVITETGLEITTTEDHPFFTNIGMKPLKKIVKGDEIAVLPFEGVEYKKPSDSLILDEKSILNLNIKKDLSYTVNELKKRDLIPLKANSDKLPYLLKLIGYLIGDGTIYFTKNKGTMWFYGKPDDLKNIRQDIKKIGFKASKIYKRERNHKIKTFYDEIKFSTTEYSIKTTSSSLAALLWALGTPINNKCSQDFEIPKWIFKLELWQKRLFLASFFGAELSSPSTVTNHGYNFYSPVLSMNKHEGYVNSGSNFLKQIKILLEDFNVKSSVIRNRKEFVNKKGRVSYRLRLQISSDLDNLLDLWGKIGFEYNKHRSYLANLAVQYLKKKKNILLERKNTELYAKKLKKSGFKKIEIYEKTKSENINLRFIERSIYENRKNKPRINFNFPKFADFILEQKEKLGISGLVWDKIVEIKDCKYNDYVYDFNVSNKYHNFIANSFVVSNCGVRLVRTNLSEKDLNHNTVQQLVDEMFKNVPSGLGSKAKIRLSKKELKDVLLKGAVSAVENGYGWTQDTEFLEEKGCLDYADTSFVSDKAIQRGLSQVGSLGAGNHFLEIQKVEKIFNPDVAKVYGINKPGQITVMIHTGSRGFGHQVCTDHLKILEKAVKKYNIWLPDRQLACAPINSKEGEAYLGAMACAANFAWANRQLIVHWIRESFEKILEDSAENMDLNIVYDVSHNIAKIEDHEVNGKKRKLCVHRKGATRAFGPGRSEMPLKYQPVGQPVLIPGDMGTESYLLHGANGSKETFGSTCHGAGRIMSRHQAIKKWRGEEIVKELKDRGIYVHPASFKVAAEEAPGAYKDISDIVDIVHGAGISKKVVSLKPIGVVKG
jgi:tRNA-splicing ligase RtcB (3'-phosphate/5'-hydroxy nucleic acid ligase)